MELIGPLLVELCDTQVPRVAVGRGTDTDGGAQATYPIKWFLDLLHLFFTSTKKAFGALILVSVLVSSA